MNFYTHVLQWGNRILVRGVKDGQRFNKRIPYKPTLYVPTDKPSKFKTLEGNPVAPIKFEDIKAAKEFLSHYENQLNLVFGINQYMSLLNIDLTFTHDTYKKYLNDIAERMFD